MATEDCNGLPVYIEENGEDVAVEKQKRQQQSQKPPFKHPWETATPEEKARRELRGAMMDKLFEFDPKTGSGSYTQVWFVDFSTFNLDESNPSLLTFVLVFYNDHSYLKIQSQVPSNCSTDYFGIFWAMFSSHLVDSGHHGTNQMISRD